MVVATTALSLGASGGVSAQETDPLQGDNVSVTFGRTTASFGRATLAYEDGTLRFRGRDWTMEGPANTLTGDTLEMSVTDVTAEGYAAIRAAMVDAAETNSPVPLVAGFATADIDPDATVRVAAAPVEQDGRVIADQVTATGSYDPVLPDGLGDVASSGTASATAIGPSKWDQMTVQRSSAELVFNDVGVTVQPSATNPTGGEPRFDLTFGEITRNGETVVTSFETSGTLSELLQALTTKAGDTADTGDTEETDDTADTSDGQQLPKVAIVSGSGDYVFEVTGDLVYLEPDEDSGPAVDEVIDTGDRVRVEGGVTTGDDRYAFSGELVEVDVPPEVEILIEER